MKLLLILGSDDNYDTIIDTIRPCGFESIRYRHVLKAMDNIDEIDPAVIIISAIDFPRHWKILTQFVRSERPETVCRIIVLKGENFPEEETAKALFLKVNALIHEEDIDGLRGILIGTTAADNYAAGTSGEARTGLLIADLWGKAIAAGKVNSVSASGLSFTLNITPPAGAITVNRELRECSLRLDNNILSPVCRIIAANVGDANAGDETVIQADFVSLPEDERPLLNRYAQTLQNRQEKRS